MLFCKSTDGLSFDDPSGLPQKAVSLEPHPVTNEYTQVSRGTMQHFATKEAWGMLAEFGYYPVTETGVESVDSLTHSRVLDSKTLVGDHVECDYIEVQKSDEDILTGLRAQRDSKLAETDKMMIPDRPHAAGKKTAWETYRQELRDMPANYVADSGTVVWPTAPA